MHWTISTNLTLKITFWFHDIAIAIRILALTLDML